MGMLTKEQRSYCMSRITSNNTKPELAFRKYIWAMGVRGYRLNSRLPGKPDLYFGRQKVAVFIDGCFWHKCPLDYIRPKSNNDYWDKKIARNVERDAETNKALSKRGVTVIRLWEHEIKKDLDGSYLRLESLLRH